MTTRNDLKTEILSDLRRTSSSDTTRVLAAISAAIKYYQPVRFWFNETRLTWTATTGEDLYIMGAESSEDGRVSREFYSIDALYVVETDGGVVALDRLDYREIETLLDANASNALPTCYAYFGRYIRLYPAPDADYTMRVVGHFKLAEPETDNEADNLWIGEAYELIKCRAKKYLYGHVWPDPGMAALMQEGERQAREQLKGATLDKTGRGYLVATDF